jgi:Protein of unknown function (DUF3987)
MWHYEKRVGVALMMLQDETDGQVHGAGAVAAPVASATVSDDGFGVEDGDERDSAALVGNDVGRDVRPRESRSRSRPWSWPRLRADWRPAVLEAPLDVFPAAMARFAREAGRAAGCDPSLAMGPMLAIAGGLLGASVRLKMGPGWYECPCVFQANVGWRGEGKGRAHALVTRPALEVDRELEDAFEAHLSRWALNRRAVEATTSSDVSHELEDDFGSRIAELSPRRTMVDEGTVSSWMELLASPGRERGLIVASNDLARHGFAARRSRARGERQRLMRLWAESTPNSGRNDAGSGPSPSPSPSPTRGGALVVGPQISMTGSVTPEMLEEMRNPERDDGFLERWLFVFPDRWARPKACDKIDVAADVLDGWREIVKKLWARAYRVADFQGGRPEIIRFGPEGKAAFDEGYDRHVEEVNSSGFPQDLRGHWARLETYAGRFWLILTVLHDLAAIVGGAEPETTPTASPEAAIGAWQLVSFFKSHARRVLSAMRDESVRSGPPRGARLVLGWIANHSDRETLSFRDLTRHFSVTKGYDREMLIEGVDWLAERRALRVLARDEHGPKKAGRPRASEWEIHPELVNGGGGSEGGGQIADG